MDGINPVTRLIKKKTDDLSDAVFKIKRDMAKADEKPTVSQLKKKLGVGKKGAKKAVNSKMDNFEVMVVEERKEK